MKKLTLLLSVLLGGCTSLPQGAVPVKDFELQQYLGTWYEIARLDHSFERGLSNVTAEYSIDENGLVRVVNRGFKRDTGEWKEVRGRAKFVKDPDEGYLKVSFFGPFYGTYAIIALDHIGYDYALVTGPSHDYLWLLSRRPVMRDDIKKKLLKVAADAGFSVDDLILVVHEIPADGSPMKVDQSGS